MKLLLAYPLYFVLFLLALLYYLLPFFAIFYLVEKAYGKFFWSDYEILAYVLMGVSCYVMTKTFPIPKVIEDEVGRLLDKLK